MSKRCTHPNCTKRPTYNVVGQTGGLYCTEHKTDGMVDVMNKRCTHPNCTKQPNYNVVGQTVGLYCAEHKTDGMVDVMSKRCTHPNCAKQPTYNVVGQTVGLYCAKHKTDGMVNVISHMCKTHLCGTCVGTKYQGYCLRCYIHTFPDRPVLRNYKTKEFAVVEYITSIYPDVTWVADKTVLDGCSARRPDLLVDLGYQIVIVEVDENQHAGYGGDICENKRTMLLSLDMGHRPVVFIRFNPDAYKKNGISISSCWGTDGLGMNIVEKTKNDEWVDRLESLQSHIEYWLHPENKTDKTVEMVQLFYDE